MTQMNGTGLLTIDMFNKQVGQETLHPLVCLFDLSRNTLPEEFCMPCDFYALVYEKDSTAPGRTFLRIVSPGEMFEIPSFRYGKNIEPEGILFHPDLLCDTSLEQNITLYPTRCRCHKYLSVQERQVLQRCLNDIGQELHHAIDRHSSPIIVSQIELLLNYCTRICCQNKG